jgi:hypothetical protein
VGLDADLGPSAAPCRGRVIAAMLAGPSARPHNPSYGSLALNDNYHAFLRQAKAFYHTIEFQRLGREIPALKASNQQISRDVCP